MEDVQPVRPSLWHCSWGILLILGGGGLFGYILIHGLSHLTDSLKQIVVPGSAELNLQPATYTVFVEEQSVVNGQIYSTTQSINGLVCRVNSVQPPAVIQLRTATANTTYTANGRSGHSVLEFSIQRAGTYAFACNYGENSKGPQVVVAVGSGAGAAIARTVLGGLAAFFGGCGTGVLAILVVILRRERAKKKLRQLSVPGTPRP